MAQTTYTDDSLEYSRAIRDVQTIKPPPGLYKRNLPFVDGDAYRVLVRLLTELDSQGKLDFILLKDEEIAAFWAQHQERVRVAQVYKQARDKLETVFNEEELKLLGIELGF